MFFQHYKVEAPKGLTEEQLTFWNEKFLGVLEGVIAFNFEEEGAVAQSLQLIFADEYRDAARQAGEWFMTKLLMDPATKEKGPLCNNASNLPALVTAAGKYAFFISVVHDDYLRFRLHSFVAAE